MMGFGELSMDLEVIDLYQESEGTEIENGGPNVYRSDIDILHIQLTACVILSLILAVTYRMWLCYGRYLDTYYGHYKSTAELLKLMHNERPDLFAKFEKSKPRCAARFKKRLAAGEV